MSWKEGTTEREPPFLANSEKLLSRHSVHHLTSFSSLGFGRVSKL